MRNIIAAIALLALFVSCGSTSRTPLTSANLVKNQIVIVGKIVVTPEVQIQELSGDLVNNVVEPKTPPKMSKDVRYFMLIATNEDLGRQNLRKNLTAIGSFPPYVCEDIPNSFADYVHNNETFIIRGNNQSELFLNGLYLIGNISSPNSVLETIFTFPLPLKIKVPEGAKAVYIGTIILERNKFYEVTNLTQKDEYDEAKKEFLKSFPGWDLVRADIIDNFVKN